MFRKIIIFPVTNSNSFFLRVLWKNSNPGILWERPGVCANIYKREGQIDPKVRPRRRDYRGFLLGIKEAKGPKSLDGQVSFRIISDELATSLWADQP